MPQLPPKPTDAELAILQALWRGGPSTVKEVQERMEEGTGYTTVLKFLQIMAEKGLVRRNEEKRAHVYEAAVSEADTQDRLVTALLKKAFGGSTSKLVLQALASKKASPDELVEIRRLINKLSKE
jgi:predicted transcriptional regulator